MFIEAYHHCQKYFEFLDNLTPIIQNSLRELNSLLEIDIYKEFKIYESYDLYKDYMITITKLEFLAGCGMRRAKERYNWLNDKFYSSLQYEADWMGDLLYMGVILSIITYYYTWGTDPITARNMFGSL